MALDAETGRSPSSCTPVMVAAATRPKEPRGKPEAIGPRVTTAGGRPGEGGVEARGRVAVALACALEEGPGRGPVPDAARSTASSAEPSYSAFASAGSAPFRAFMMRSADQAAVELGAPAGRVICRGRSGPRPAMPPVASDHASAAASVPFVNLAASRDDIAMMVSAGLAEPCVGQTLPSEMNRFGTGHVRRFASTTLSAGEVPILAPPMRWA